MSSPTTPAEVQALLVLPHLRVQNANAISSPMTHGFPSITAFIGHMWALQRKLTAAGIPLKLHQVGVICHHHEEQVTDGYVKTFHLTRNPLDSGGNVCAIVEEGRMHLDITLLYRVTLVENATGEASFPADLTPLMSAWAEQIGEIVSCMRIAGGTLLPVDLVRGRRTRAWMEPVHEEEHAQIEAFARWRRQWLPGYALVGRDDLLKERHRALLDKQPDATLLDAWLHAARFNLEPVADQAPDGKKFRWADPARQKGGGWTVPMSVGYMTLAGPLPAGSVAHARDASTPFVFAEAIYSFGEWIGPHRLEHLDQLFWRPETDLEKGVYRCRSGYQRQGSETAFDDLPDYE